MKQIYLNQGKITLVDDNDYNNLMLYGWYFHISKKSNYGYAYTTIKVSNKRTTIRMHQMIIGPIDKGFKIDHIDRDGLNNQRHNLRVCTFSQDAQNSIKHQDGSSKYKGVSYYKRTNKWHAEIRVNGTKIDLGYHSNEIAAAELYDLAAKLYFGEFARLNFPE